jgi:hypothetical protein
MKIELKSIPISELVSGYKDNSHLEQGIIAYSENLNVRPAYQREFVYNIDQRNAVITSVMNRLPINVMYWVQNGTSSFEVLDGQQRTISICQFVSGEFSILDLSENPKYFSNLTKDVQDEILNYELMVYFCQGTSQEKLDWFKTINISGEKLTNQELRNAVYTGEWLSYAKSFFSKTNCPAYNFANRYVKGVPIKQDYLETALLWIADSKSCDIETYMSNHQSDIIPQNTSNYSFELWDYFQKVIMWVHSVFPTYRRDMRGIPWGFLFNQHSTQEYDPVTIESTYRALLNDDEVQLRSTKGIYYYLLSGNEKHLNLRTFDAKDKQLAYETQKGVCLSCKANFLLEQMEADHIVPWSSGGKTIQANLQMLCKPCNRTKSNT